MKLQRLNMDNSWLIELNNYRILVDPWLEGVEVDYFSWFNTQWHKVKPLPYDELPEFDLVLITQKYPDHFHEKTLQRIQPKVIAAPVYLKKKIEKLLPNSRGIYFSENNKTHVFSDVAIVWYSSNRRIDPIYDAYLVRTNSESVFIAPHGFHFKLTDKIEQSVDLLITPFNEFKLPFFLGGVIAPGINGISHLNKILNPKYIVSTHDEDKYSKGLVMKWAQVKRYNAQDFIQIKLFENQLLEINHYNQVVL